MNDYTESILNFEDDFLKKLREGSARERDNVPILRPDAAALLNTLTALCRPKRILEAGTAIGYSSLLMAKTAKSVLASGMKLHIDTVEIDEDTASIARRNIKNAGFGDIIRVINGDAAEVFSCLNGTYDMIFVDSAKSHYIDMYEDIKRLLAPGGLLVCDNVIFYGKIYEEPKKAPHKHRTIVTKLRTFLERLCDDGDFVSSILDTGDGMAVAVKIKEES